jgi:DNA mismatch endonuclease (patch repair protein)
MADSFTPEKRSWIMGRVHGKDTTIEVKVRKYLFHEGFRYRKNDSRLPGKPDIVLPKYRTVIFIHGCFWHRHPGCKRATTPKSNYEYWQKKFERNVQNDKKNQELLSNMGWNVIILWECEIDKHFNETMDSLVKRIRCNSPHLGK